MNIPGATGVLRATVTVTRRDGTKQEYQLVGAATPEQVRELLKGQRDGQIAEAAIPRKNG